VFLKIRLVLWYSVIVVIHSILTSMGFSQSRSHRLRSPWPADWKQELWEQPFQACALDADYAMKPDEQNSVISFVISRWLLPELSFCDRWSRGTKPLGRRLGFFSKPLFFKMWNKSTHAFHIILLRKCSRRHFRNVCIRYSFNFTRP